MKPMTRYIILRVIALAVLVFFLLNVIMLFIVYHPEVPTFGRIATVWILFATMMNIFNNNIPPPNNKRNNDKDNWFPNTPAI